METKAPPRPRLPSVEEAEEATSVQEEVCMLVTARQWCAMKIRAHCTCVCVHVHFENDCNFLLNLKRTPLRPGKGVKRKNASPTPSSCTSTPPAPGTPAAGFVTPSKDRDGEFQ